MNASHKKPAQRHETETNSAVVVQGQHEKSEDVIYDDDQDAGLSGSIIAERQSLVVKSPPSTQGDKAKKDKKKKKHKDKKRKKKKDKKEKKKLDKEAKKKLRESSISQGPAGHETSRSNS